MMNKGNSYQMSYHLMNEYLENPGKQSNILIDANFTCSDISYINDESKMKESRSRGKREKVISYPAKSYIKVPNMYQAAGSSAKKMSFKSFDHRRALTKLEHREGSFEDPANYLYSNPIRSSSACHKNTHNNERSSSTHKKSTKVNIKQGGDQNMIKPASHRHKQKIKQKQGLNNLKRISATQAMINLIKNSKFK